MFDVTRRDGWIWKLGTGSWSEDSDAGTGPVGFGVVLHGGNDSGELGEGRMEIERNAMEEVEY